MVKDKWLEGFKENKDYIFFLAVIPLILLLVYSLPQDIKTSYFVLQPPHPNIPSLLLSSYNHSSIEHLSGNLVSYLLIIYFILVLEKKKERLYATLIFIFIALPIILSLLNTWVTPILKNDTGFSGIISGLFGYYLVCIYTYFKEFRKVKIGWEFLYLFIIANCSIVLYNFQSSFNLGSYLTWAFFLSILLTVYALLLNISAIKRIIELVIRDITLEKRFWWRYGKICFAILGVFFLFGLTIILPAAVQFMGAFVVNTPVHYFGYVIGLFLPAVIVYQNDEKGDIAKVFRIIKEWVVKLLKKIEKSKIKLLGAEIRLWPMARAIIYLLIYATSAAFFFTFAAAFYAVLKVALEQIIITPAKDLAFWGLISVLILVMYTVIAFWILEIILKSLSRMSEETHKISHEVTSKEKESNGVSSNSDFILLIMIAAFLLFYSFNFIKAAYPPTSLQFYSAGNGITIDITCRPFEGLWPIYGNNITCYGFYTISGNWTRDLALTFSLNNTNIDNKEMEYSINQTPTTVLKSNGSEMFNMGFVNGWAFVTGRPGLHEIELISHFNEPINLTFNKQIYTTLTSEEYERRTFDQIGIIAGIVGGGLLVSTEIISRVRSIVGRNKGESESEIRPKPRK